MGDPKFCRRKYDTPSHPWQGDRISEENALIKKYGLKNKKELWKAKSLLRSFRQRSRRLQARLRIGDTQADIEAQQLLERLKTQGILSGEESTLNDVLVLDVEVVLGRRLQTLAYMKGLAYTPKQARQFIVHGHTYVNNRKVTIPGYLVKKIEEDTIEYSPASPLANDLHPARPGVEPTAPVEKETEETSADAKADKEKQEAGETEEKSEKGGVKKEKEDRKDKKGQDEKEGKQGLKEAKEGKEGGKKERDEKEEKGGKKVEKSG